MKYELKGVPEGKKRGFCEPPETSTNGGVIVKLEQCSRCQVGHCHMFKINPNKPGIKVFQQHQPEY